VNFKVLSVRNFSCLIGIINYFTVDHITCQIEHSPTRTEPEWSDMERLCPVFKGDSGDQVGSEIQGSVSVCDVQKN
jgi:hypothetical protein